MDKQKPQPKTIPNSSSVSDYIAKIEDQQRRVDAAKVCALMESVTGEPAVMWGSSIIGFGKLHYAYASGLEGDTIVVGLAARKNALTIYGLLYHDLNAPLAAKLGKVTTGKSCVYIKSLEDIDLMVLGKMIGIAYKHRNALSADA